jgi:hypothetical protein
MIISASEFITLRTSENREEYTRAGHDTAPEEVWMELIENYPHMRWGVAYNKTIPHSIIKILAEDSDPRVRHMIAMKHKTDPSLLEKLAHDPDESIRLQVAVNKKTPAYILRKLLNDEWVEVVERAQKRLNDLEHPQ